jgi:NTE family protein
MQILAISILSLILAGCATRPAEVHPPAAPLIVPEIITTAPAVAVTVPKIPPRIGLALGGGGSCKGICPCRCDSGSGGSRYPGGPGGWNVGWQPGGCFVCQRQATGSQLQQVAETMEEATYCRLDAAPFQPWRAAGGGAGALCEPAGRISVLIEGLPLPLGIVATDLRTRPGHAVSERRCRHRGASFQRCASGVPAGRISRAVSMWTVVWCRLCRCGARQMGAELVIAVDISSAPEGNPASDTLRNPAADVLPS